MHLEEELTSSSLQKFVSGNHMMYTQKEHAQPIPYKPLLDENWRITVIARCHDDLVSRLQIFVGLPVVQNFVRKVPNHCCECSCSL